jgi:hypothetical protein
MKSSVKVLVAVERCYWYAGRSWFVEWTGPMGGEFGSCAVVDDFGNLVAVA